MMYKFLVHVFATATLMFASNAKQIIALEYATGTLTQSYGSGTADNKSVTEYGFKLGAKENDYRLFISYRYQKIGATDTGNHAGMEFDAFFQMGFLGLYLGPVAGYSWYDFTGQDTLVRSASLPYYGGNAGLTMTLGFIELDAGARYSYYNDALVASVASQVYTVNNMLTYYVGLNYLY